MWRRRARCRGADSLSGPGARGKGLRTSHRVEGRGQARAAPSALSRPCGASGVGLGRAAALPARRPKADSGNKPQLLSPPSPGAAPTNQTLGGRDPTGSSGSDAPE